MSTSHNGHDSSHAEHTDQAAAEAHEDQETGGLAGALNPLFKSTVRGTYKLAQKSREMFAEAHEQVHDVLAEVKAETEAAKAAATERPAA